MRKTAQAGDVLSDRYVLERELGRGGMGVVFQARDRKYGREVAVKLLPAEVSTFVRADRFIAETRTAARLNHANILTVHDGGEDEGQLYYVMPRVEGESLRQRLDRERRLPFVDAVAITGQVARALAYAHAHGVVHRDVKPENILVDRVGHAWLADFGIARVLAPMATSRTEEGVVMGAPRYMSPEQFDPGTRVVDARGDVYSLGCVLYEMMAGEPPFTGRTLHALMAQHISEAPPPLRSRRADVPAAVDEVVRTALAKSPDERYPSADAFAQALEAAAGIRPVRTRIPGRPRTRVGWWTAAGTAALVVLLATFATWSILFPPDLVPMRITALPFQQEAGSASSLREDARLREALGRWNGIEAPDRTTLDEILRRIDGRGLPPRGALRAARRLGAGSYIHGTVARTGDGTTVQAGLYDAADNRALGRVSMRVASATQASDSLFALLADSLLFGRVTWEDGPRVDIGTRSYFARLNYGAAHAALELWDLPKAESLFNAAATHDPDFARAQLWLAEVRNWAGDEPVGSETAVGRALRGAEHLAPRERRLAQGLMHLARGEYGEACEIYDQLRAADPGDFAAWYGRGECHRLDVLVVRDDASPSGWSFRSSYHQAVEAYRRAFTILPRTFTGFATGGYERIRRIFYARPNRVRLGASIAADSMTFFAWPVWQGDSLAMLPVPWAPGTAQIRRPPPAVHEPAVEMQRRAFQEIATIWARAFPESGEAVYAVAASLEMMDDPAALDTLRRARSLAVDPALQLRLAASEVWLRVKFGMPDTLELLTAAELADSLVRSSEPRDSDAAEILAQLAALIGRPAAAAALARRAARVDTEVARIPAHVVATLDALLAFAAVGAPVDSIVQLERQAESVVHGAIPEHERDAVRRFYLERAAILAFPRVEFRVLHSMGSFQSPVAPAQAAFARKDSVRARMLVQELVGRLEPSAVEIDMVLPIATLLVTAGDTLASIRWLAEGLAAVRWADPGLLDELGTAGTLGRAIALHASLSAATGDTITARTWAAAAAALWGRADPWLRPAVAEMRRLAAPL